MIPVCSCFQNQWLIACFSNFSTHTDHLGALLNTGSDSVSRGWDSQVMPKCWSMHGTLIQKDAEKYQKVRLPLCHIRLLSTWNVASVKLNFTFYVILVHFNLNTEAVYFYHWTEPDCFGRTTLTLASQNKLLMYCSTCIPFTF